MHFCDTETNVLCFFLNAIRAEKVALFADWPPAVIAGATADMSTLFR
jgi:hypothetical protein